MQVGEDPRVPFPMLFGSCYIGEWTAAHHWYLTQQRFNETLEFTTKRTSARRASVQGIVFLLHHVGQNASSASIPSGAARCARAARTRRGH